LNKIEVFSLDIVETVETSHFLYICLYSISVESIETEARACPSLSCH
jgi:hypothetical protein